MSAAQQDDTGSEEILGGALVSEGGGKSSAQPVSVAGSEEYARVGTGSAGMSSGSVVGTIIHQGIQEGGVLNSGLNAGESHSSPPASRALARGLVLARTSRTAVDSLVNTSVISTPILSATSARSEHIAGLEYRLASIGARRVGALERAQEALMIVRQLMVRETGTPHLDDALPLFFRRLCAEEHIQDLVQSIVRDASLALTTQRSRDRFSSPSGIVESLDALVGWYIRRTASLQVLDEVSIGDEQEECLFNMRVTHDVVWAGEAGLEVSCGLRLLGRASQPLWLKLFVRSEGRPVAPREGYQQWVDDSEPLLVTSEDAAARVAAVSQFTPVRQRQIIDRAALFLPYASMLLPAGSREVELELGLYDEHGFPVFESSQLETLSIPRRAQHEHALAHAGVVPYVRLPSPQVLGVWSESPVSGTRLHHVRAEVVARQTSRVGGRPAVQVSFDASLCGHAAETLFVEARVLERDGTAVRSVTPSSDEGLSLGAFVVRQEIHPESSFHAVRDATIGFPVDALDLEAGEHELFLELSILGSDNRVVVGSLAPLRLLMEPMVTRSEQSAIPQGVLVSSGNPSSIGGSALAGTVTLGEQLSGLEVCSTHVESGYDCSADRKRTIRVEAVARDARNVRALLRMQTILEVPDRGALLAETVLVPVNPASGDFRYVGHFDESLVLGLLARADAERGGSDSKLSTAVIGPQKIGIRLEWWSSDDQLLLSRQVPFSIAGHLSVPSEVVGPEIVSDEARIVDVSLAPAPIVGAQDGALPCASITWLVPAHEVGANLPCVFAQLLDAAGEGLEAGVKETGSTLTGSILRADPALKGLHLRRGSMVSCSLPFVVSDGDWKRAHAVKLMAFSSSGRVTQVVSLQVPRERGATVTHDVVRGKGASSGGQAESSPTAPSQSGLNQSAPSEQAPKEGRRRAKQDRPQSWLQRVLG